MSTDPTTGPTTLRRKPPAQQDPPPRVASVDAAAGEGVVASEVRIDQKALRRMVRRRTHRKVHRPRRTRPGVERLTDRFRAMREEMVVAARKGMGDEEQGTGDEGKVEGKGMGGEEQGMGDE